LLPSLSRRVSVTQSATSTGTWIFFGDLSQQSQEFQ
jgi:hypothetical protein